MDRSALRPFSVAASKFLMHGVVCSVTALLIIGGVMETASAQTTPTVEEQVKQLQSQVQLLQQQVAVSVAQQTEQANITKGITDALKGQVTSQSDLDKALAQADFAKLAGIKAGMDSVGAPAGKEGKLTISSGTAGALMLRLKTPMLTGLDALAAELVTTAKGQGVTHVVMISDADLESALLSSLRSTAISDSISQLKKATAAVKGPGVQASLFPQIAAVGLLLNSVNNLDKFFRADRTISLFDFSEEARELFLLLLEQNFRGATIPLVDVNFIDPTSFLKWATSAQKDLDLLRDERNTASAHLAAIEKLPAADPNRPTADKVEALKVAAQAATDLLGALHPNQKMDEFWKYVVGLYRHDRMKVAGAYLPRLSFTVKAQAIQVIESRVFRSDKLYGAADVQVSYRLVAADSKVLASGVKLKSFNQKKARYDELPAPVNLTLPP